MYSDIPIHIRLSERWLVDPGYDAKRYFRDIDLKHCAGRYPTSDRKPELTVPGIVIDFARRQPAFGRKRRLLEIAGALKMPPLQLFDICRWADLKEEAENKRGAG